MTIPDRSVMPLLNRKPCRFVASVTKSVVFEARIELATCKGKLIYDRFKDRYSRILPDHMMHLAPHRAYCLRDPLKVLSSHDRTHGVLAGMGLHRNASDVRYFIR
jgi:hypothetical protein